MQTIPVVVKYRFKWDLDTHAGEIQLQVVKSLDPRQTSKVVVHPQDAAEMGLLIDLLRNESPVTYDSSTKVISSFSWESAGEGES